MLTLNRYILLDPILLFFISSSVYTMVKFHNQRDRYIEITSLSFSFCNPFTIWVVVMQAVLFYLVVLACFDWIDANWCS